MCGYDLVFENVPVEMVEMALPGAWVKVGDFGLYTLT